MMRIKVANYSINSDKTSLEMDIHVDNNVLGKGCLILHDFDRPINVTVYNPEDGSKCLRTVTAVLDYYHPNTGKLYLLVTNQAISLDHLEYNLMCTMQ